jgi:hypothetical protein
MISYKEGIDMATSIVDVVHDIYGDDRRKGLYKPAYAHPVDVLGNSYIECIDDGVRSAKLFKGCLLHDALEDSDYTSEDLQKKLDLDDDEIGLVERVSRNIPNGDGTNYVDGVVNDEDSLIVKFADRIANIKDLIRWANKTDGFTSESLKIANKYLKETNTLLDKAEKKYPEYMKADSNHPFFYQTTHLNNLVIQLDRLVDKYDDAALVESVIYEKVFKDEKEFKDITQDDINRTYEIVKDLYSRSQKLQTAYPDFMKRLSKVIDGVEQKVKEKGYPYMQELLNKVHFDEDDFFSAYMGQVDQQLYEHITKLQNFSESIPKVGLRKILAEQMGVTIGKMTEMLQDTNPDTIEKVYKAIVAVMGQDFDNVVAIVKKIAGDLGGDIRYRPDKFKTLKSARDKFIEGVQGGDYVEMLDLVDYMGFRAVFDDIKLVVDFALKIVKDPDNYVFKMSRYIGKGSAYQGVNMAINYEGKFNYEVQSVIDKVQVATDLNHDVFYKKLMEITDEEKDAVLRLVQISLGLLFDDLFSFGAGGGTAKTTKGETEPAK